MRYAIIATMGDTESNLGGETSQERAKTIARALSRHVKADVTQIDVRDAYLYDMNDDRGTVVMQLVRKIDGNFYDLFE